MKSLPIGTIVKVKNLQMMIVGYTAIKSEKGIRSAYSLVPHPEGYIDENSLISMACDEVHMVQTGYISDEANIILNIQEKLNVLFDVIPEEKWEEFIESEIKGSEAYEK